MENRVGWYYRFSSFLQARFGCRVVKIPIAAGFTCPNRDGTLGYGGCTYCYNPGFSPGEAQGSVTEQIRQGKARAGRGQKVKFLAYFQPYTNTYAHPDILKANFDAALAEADVVGLAIATRPDCVDSQILDLLTGYARNYHVWLEYGLQSIHDRTLAAINRGHTAVQFREAVVASQGRGLYLGAHVILGLPGEDERDMLATVQALNELGVDGVKFHHLQVVKHTPMADQYARGEIKTLSFNEYLHLICSLLEHLAPDIVVQRLLGEVQKDDLLLAPRWELTKSQVLSAIEKELIKRGSWQGKRHGG